MSLKYALGYASCVGILVLGKPLKTNSSLNIVNSSITHTHPPLGLLTLNYPISALNESGTNPNNVTGEEDIHIQCDGASYGFDLDIGECEQAKAYFPANPNQFQWAERHTGWQKEIFILPYRAMGDEASCYVQPILVDGATSARATPNEVRNAAAMIRHICYSRGKLQGGIATNIGKTKKALRKGHKFVIGL